MKIRWRIFTITLIFVGVLSLWGCDNNTECCLCNNIPRHAPCLINLSTGEIVELRVYEPHPFNPVQIAEEQTGGYMCLISGTGIEGYQIAAEYAQVTISPSVNTRDKAFCNSCQKMLAAYGDTYVLADFIEPTDPIVYPLKAGCFDLRCYFVDISYTEGKYQITVTGAL